MVPLQLNQTRLRSLLVVMQKRWSVAIALLLPGAAAPEAEAGSSGLFHCPASAGHSDDPQNPGFAGQSDTRIGV